MQEGKTKKWREIIFGTENEDNLGDGYALKQMSAVATEINRKSFFYSIFCTVILVLIPLGANDIFN